MKKSICFLKSTLAAALLLEAVFSHFLHQQIDI